MGLRWKETPEEGDLPLFRDDSRVGDSSVREKDGMEMTLRVGVGEQLSIGVGICSFLLLDVDVVELVGLWTSRGICRKGERGRPGFSCGGCEDPPINPMGGFREGREGILGFGMGFVEGWVKKLSVVFSHCL